MGKWWDEVCEPELAKGNHFGAEDPTAHFADPKETDAFLKSLKGVKDAQRQNRALIAVAVGTGLVLTGVTMGLARMIDKEQERLTPRRRY